MKCLQVQHFLTDYLYDELSWWRRRQVAHHVEKCHQCQRELELLRKTRAVLHLWKEVEPSRELGERLTERLVEESLSVFGKIEEGPQWSSPRSFLPIGYGTLAASVSIVVFARNALEPTIDLRIVLVCGMFWATVYSLFFKFALNGFLMTAVSRAIVKPVVSAILLAMGFATVMTFLLPFLVREERVEFIYLSSRDPLVLGLYFLLGAGYALLSLFLGAILAPEPPKGKIFLYGSVAGCFFALVLAPGLIILCIPFTLGLYAMLLLGSTVGAIAGGTLGFWISGRLFGVSR
ncbi:MAG: zf-HC2 domain-containing protein [Candidatus Tectomicrobia bacterium]|nr:zf-HC2 domain-containing protein [Candidatus Tectomicrobia bacterium]